MIIQAPRASAILYGLLVSRSQTHPWLLPANICPIVPITFLKADVPFEFVDISPVTLRMDVEQVEERVRKRKIGGLLYAHPYGEAHTPREFFISLKQLEPDILIIDDCCLCIPKTTLHDDAEADVTLFSTGYAKIAELNFGGYAFLKPQVVYQPAHLPFDAAHYDALEKEYKEAVSNRARFHYQNSDWLETETPQPKWEAYCAQIERRLHSTLPHRAALNAIYEKMLPEEIRLSKEYQYWRCNIRVRDKENILHAIFADGLFASSHYTSLAGIMEDGHAPNAETLAGEVINLFNDEHFDEEKAQRTCDIILRNL